MNLVAIKMSIVTKSTLKSSPFKFPNLSTWMTITCSTSFSPSLIFLFFLRTIHMCHFISEIFVTLFYNHHLSSCFNCFFIIYNNQINSQYISTIESFQASLFILTLQSHFCVGQSCQEDLSAKTCKSCTLFLIKRLQGSLENASWLLMQIVDSCIVKS